MPQILYVWTRATTSGSGGRAPGGPLPLTGKNFRPTGCGSRKYPYPTLGRSMEILRPGGGLNSLCYKGKFEG